MTPKLLALESQRSDAKLSLRAAIAVRDGRAAEDAQRLIKEIDAQIRKENLKAALAA